ncbi:type IV pilin N-terminal domain-containing protein [Methanosarcina barkeri]
MEGKKSRTLGEKCQAVSEVYGQILMVVVTIILAASLV